jgi:hypothetical protein
MTAAEVRCRVTMDEVSPHLADLSRKIRDRAASQVEQAIAKPAAAFIFALQEALEPVTGHRCDRLVQDLVEAMLEDLRPVAIDSAEQAAMRGLINHLAGLDRGADPSRG